MKLAANISMMYGEWPFLERLKAAFEDGFTAVECMFPYEVSAQALASAKADLELYFALINAPAGRWADGERGLAANYSDVDRFKHSIDDALLYAKALDVKKVHVLGGCVPPDNIQQAEDTYLRNLDWLCSNTIDENITWLIEPLNPRDVPNYILSTQAVAHDILAKLNKPNLKVQMDLYHCQVTEGDVITKLKKYIPTGNVGHIQIAGAPERCEPTEGELNMPRIFRELEALQYSGYVGCEYKPKSTTREGLSWVKSPVFSGKM